MRQTSRPSSPSSSSSSFSSGSDEASDEVALPGASGSSLHASRSRASHVAKDSALTQRKYHESCSAAPPSRGVGALCLGTRASVKGPASDNPPSFAAASPPHVPGSTWEGRRQRDRQLWAGTRAPPPPLFGTHAARVLLLGPARSPKASGSACGVVGGRTGGRAPAAPRLIRSIWSIWPVLAPAFGHAGLRARSGLAAPRGSAGRPDLSRRGPGRGRGGRRGSSGAQRPRSRQMKTRRGGGACAVEPMCYHTTVHTTIAWLSALRNALCNALRGARRGARRGTLL